MWKVVLAVACAGRFDERLGELSVCEIECARPPDPGSVIVVAFVQVQSQNELRVGLVEAGDPPDEQSERTRIGVRHQAWTGLGALAPVEDRARDEQRS